MDKRKIVEDWLTKNKEFIKYESLEREVGIQRGCIQKFLKYGRNLNDSRISTLYEFIVNIWNKI